MRLARHVLTIVALSVAGAGAAHAQVKIAFINSKDLLERAPDDERAASGYTMIVDLAAQSSPIVAFDKNLDITERVLSRLATMKPAPAAPRPNAAAPAAGTGTPTRPAGA